MTSNPCDTPCDTCMVCSMGAGAWVWPAIRLGSEALLPAGAMPAMLGAGASLMSVDFATAWEALFLIMMGAGATAVVAGSFFAVVLLAEAEGMGFTSLFSGLAFTLFGLTFGFSSTGLVCVSESEEFSVVSLGWGTATASGAGDVAGFGAEAGAATGATLGATFGAVTGVLTGCVATCAGGVV